MENLSTVLFLLGLVSWHQELSARKKQSCTGVISLVVFNGVKKLQ